MVILVRSYARSFQLRCSTQFFTVTEHFSTVSSLTFDLRSRPGGRSRGARQELQAAAPLCGVHKGQGERRWGWQRTTSPTGCETEYRATEQQPPPSTLLHLGLRFPRCTINRCHRLPGKHLPPPPPPLGFARHAVRGEWKGKQRFMWASLRWKGYRSHMTHQESPAGRRRRRRRC